jgi:hypothetical protein
MIGRTNRPSGTDDTLRALDTIQRLLNAVSGAEQAAEVDKLKGELMRTRFSEIQRTASDRAKRSATEGTPLEGLPPWRDVIAPHPDVCSGTFAQAEFAADLAQVYRGDALAEYGDPKEFFRRTYLTEGLSGLLLNAIKTPKRQGWSSRHPAPDEFRRRKDTLDARSVSSRQRCSG